eukprot:GHVU01027995.1.p1 GENE.GHVU01027995.1~~GHVU01027995.1.p1  ORF type:complete len:245 (+),score=18.51 GHVU01027995.1:158-892(+)
MPFSSNPPMRSHAVQKQLRDAIDFLRSATPFARTKRFSMPPIGSAITFKSYEDGMTHAHHYPSRILPVEHSYVVPHQFLVNPVLPSTLDRRRPVPLSSVLLQSTTVVVSWSGLSKHSDPAAAYAWLDAVRPLLKEEKLVTQGRLRIALLNISSAPVHIAWLRRRIAQHYLSHLAANYAKECDVYYFHGRMPENLERALMLQNDSFVSAALCDRKARVRWHAVGKPTPEAEALLKASIRVAAFER